MSAEHAHSHAHPHGPGHSHAPAHYNRAFAVGVTLNALYVVVELIAGFRIDSVALIADAGHNVSDVLSLLLAWGASYLAQRPPSRHHTYGLRKTSILASLTNAVLLLIAIGAIAWEALQRFAHPPPVTGGAMMWVAAIGVVVNTATALLFLRGRHSDINLRGAYLHMAADAAVSVGVVLAGFAILLTGALWIDPAISLVIVAVIGVGTWSLLRDSFRLATDAVPPGIDLPAVRRFLRDQPGVTDVHDLHIWAMSTTSTALTAHLVKPAPGDDDALLRHLGEALHEHFAIGHTTIQIERTAGPCSGCAAPAPL
ncbi:cation diffusion facilitator family transporter [Horticoccus luteus]|uniref:Cation diffusion facilitator family transporter n=1 Tax=Horticoccus luteus TaxID=2862869 RepID=A0A8F9XJ36_9BACT|nr:cation diffusion facilitator family transporter [Horticoccus luteus]QYM78248.1 cation diffusion facilitator family transporter [Horticoccus luteus]